jgi:superfamily II DNA/RNA helicase
MSDSFASLGVPDDLVSALALRGILEPFDVQSATIPDAIAGRDVCGRAPTGSGKTIAFGLPVLTRISRAEKRRPTALVLAPTRELAAQISRELEPLAGSRARRVYAIYGGVGYEPQKRKLNRGVDVLVACPGRLADLINQKAVDLSAVEVVVIDEADRMADMGFLPEVRKLLNMTPESRQTLLFSATLDGAVGVLTREYQKNAQRHEVGAPEPDGRGAHHVFWRVEGPPRAQVLAELVPVAGPTIVFTKTRRGADRLMTQLEKQGVRAAAIHGGRSQNQRDRALQSFMNGHVDALVATDVAARGIHVDGVACVVHYDTPEDEKAYLHRSGRTARAGADGIVVSFVSNQDRRSVQRMQKKLDIVYRLTPPDVAAIKELVGDRPVPIRTKPERAPREEREAAPKSRDRRPSNARNNRKPGGYRKQGGNGNRSATGNRNERGDRSENGTRKPGGNRSESGNRSANGNRSSSGHRNESGNRSAGGNRNANGNRNASGNRSANGDRRDGGNGARRGRAA